MQDEVDTFRAPQCLVAFPASVRLGAPPVFSKTGVRLLVFTDQIYWTDGDARSTDEAYVMFPLAFAEFADELIFLGRHAPRPDRKSYVVQGSNVRFQPLPFYESLYDLRRMGPRFHLQLDEACRSALMLCDVAWICGPNPVARRLARQCAAMDKPFFLVVRQNLMGQMAARHRGFKRLFAMAAASLEERQFQRLARGRTVFAVGEEMAAAYRRITVRTHVHYSSRVTQAYQLEYALPFDPPATQRLLAVGRLSAEKGYRHLLAALGRLKKTGTECHLDLIGSGPEEASLRKQGLELGLADRVTFFGYVDFGPKLFSYYRNSTVLIVPSLSGEGFPQVICEALLLGLPVVASTVGGIPAVLEHGETALLVPPGNESALAEAIQLLLNSPDLWRRISRNGRERMCDFTLEAQRDRMLEIIHSEVLARCH